MRNPDENKGTYECGAGRPRELSEQFLVPERTISRRASEGGMAARTATGTVFATRT